MRTPSMHGMGYSMGEVGTSGPAAGTGPTQNVSRQTTSASQSPRWLDRRAKREPRALGEGPESTKGSFAQQSPLRQSAAMAANGVPNGVASGALVAAGEVRDALPAPDLGDLSLETQTHAVGLIHPPPDIRAIVDKTAQFVAKNGGCRLGQLACP